MSLSSYELLRHLKLYEHLMALSSASRQESVTRIQVERAQAMQQNEVEYSMGDVNNFIGVKLGPIDFYVSGVIALWVQYMAVTLAALAIVREERSGSIELLRPAPISSFETLTGKSISYMVLTVILAIILTALVVLGLQTPMLGNWAAFAMLILSLLFTSLSMGFAISVISETDTQAVQYSMIVLPASIFFSDTNTAYFFSSSNFS